MVFPLVRVAHRGASAECPENTLMAYRRAIEIGVDAIELDIHLSGDGVLVAMHDSTLDRTTNGSGLVHDHTFAQLRELDAGRGEKIPTLDEAIALARPAGIRLCVEIKGATPADELKVAEAVVRGLEKADYARQVIVTAFSGPALMRVRALNPLISTMLDPSPQDGSLTPLQVCEQGFLAQVNSLSYDGKVTTPEVAAEARLAGLALWPLVEESPDEMRAMIRLGIPGIMTDHPEILNKVLADFVS